MNRTTFARPIAGATLIATLLVAGCAANASPTPSVASAAGSDASTSASAGTDASASAGAASGGTGAVTDFCLNTAEEVSGVLGVEVGEPAGAEAPGVGGGCNFSTEDGTLVYAISVVTNDAAPQTFEAAKTQAGAEAVTGIGDDAVHVSELGPLAILAGDVVISLGVVAVGDLADIDVKAANEELGRLAVDNL